MTSATFHELVQYDIGGGWGTDEAEADSSAIGYVIRGTDIPRVAVGEVSTVPLRFHKPSNLASRVLKSGDIVFEVSGGSKGQPVGRALQITDDVLAKFDEPVMCASFCKLIRPDRQKIEPGYLFRILQAAYSDGRLDTYQVQSTGITNFKWKPFLEHFGVSLPERSVQRRVAATLDAFDDLIENNRRRVAVLEEMARTIYREWFVKFRYPGHEHVPLVDSTLGLIPKGWIAGTVGDALELKYGKALKADARRGGEVAVVSSAGLVGWHDESLVGGPAIVVGRKGNVGSVHWIDGPCWPIDTAYYVATGLPLRFVVEQLRRTEFTNTHAAVPGLSREGAYARPFLIPPNDLLDNYQSTVDPLGTEASALARQSDSLGSLRDLLLPKLVTGKIDVSALDLNALVQEGVGS